MRAIDLFQMLTPQERQRFLKQLQTHHSPCERNGHRYKVIGKEFRWFQPPAIKCICSACGQVVWR